MKDKQNEFYDTNFSRPVKFDKSFEISPDKTWRTFENQPSKNLNAQSKLKSIFSQEFRDSGRFFLHFRKISWNLTF